MKLIERLRQSLAHRKPERLEIPGFQDAAVLVPVIERNDALSVALILRSHELPTHAGQISFPGGHRHPNEAHPVETALREAEEEIGIDPSLVELLGPLDDVPTPVGFVISPVVGWLREPAAFRPDPREVKEVFEVALTALIDPSNYAYRGERIVFGRPYPLPEYRVGDRIVWGATARIIEHLLELLGFPPPRSN